MKLTVQNKLFVGFGTVLIILVMVSANTYYRMQKASEIQERLTHLRTPTVEASLHLKDGVNLSLAGLRGYMILGADANKAKVFKRERANGWKEIDQALVDIRELSKHRDAGKNYVKLKELETLVQEFRIAQQEVEDISHTNANIPSYHILLSQAAPRASEVLKAISALIDEEGNQEATGSRKKLLKLLADSRGSFALGLANIRAYLLSGDSKFRDNYLAKWKVNETRFSQIASLSSLFTSSQKVIWQDYKTNRSKFSEYPAKMFDSRASKEWNLANYWLGTKAAPKAQRIMEIIEKVIHFQEELEANDITLLEEQTKLSITMMIVGTLIALIIGVIVSLVISRSILLPLQKVVARAKQVAKGDLTGAEIELKGKDEITELTAAINAMSRGLLELVQHVSSSTNDLAFAAKQLYQTAEQTSKGMDNQRNETDQVATAMNEMTATVHEVARSASEAATSATEADNEAGQGKVVVGKNVEGIHKLASSIEQATQTINKLGEDTKSVDDIVEVISGIADQTNLLALNAAIEAARAGEQGRGFAVVADEVRTLAASTQESTEEIRSMLDRLKIGANEAVHAMDEGHKQAQKSVEQAKIASESLGSITASVGEINSMNIQIATAAEEQSSVAEEMNRSIVRISTESESTLNNSRETGVAAKQVDALSRDLQEIVSKFKVA